MLSSDEAPRRLRSPPFPFISLGRAIDRVRQLYPKALHHMVGLDILAEAWGYGPKSSGLIQTAAALIQFGLMVDEGSGDRRKFQIKKEAIRIIQDADPESEKRKDLIKRAALAPKIHQELWRRFKATPISESILRNYLMFDRAEAKEAPFSPEAANTLISKYKTTISFANISGDEVFAPLLPGDGDELETRKTEAVATVAKLSDNAPVPETRTGRAPLKKGMKEDVFSLPEGDVVLQWPSQLSAESYEDLAAWTEIILRKIKRAVSSASDNVVGKE